ncbi:MAG: ABC transporter substrate-binding protein [Clostridia bacterium]|nr:ABC transporter substrate-binding protein [Clostridia bacterium]
MKKIITLLLSAMLCICAATTAISCGKQSDYNVEVIQYAPHESLDAANKGFCDALEEWAKSENKTISFKQSGASGEASNILTAVNVAIANNPDAILAIATPVAVSLAGATSDIPVLYTAVTDPNADSSKLTGRSNVYGTSDMQPVDQQIDLIKDLLPSVNKIAFVFSSEEPNSRTQVELAKQECDILGISYEEKTVTDVNSIQPTIQSISSDVDAIYIPTDNTLAANMGVVATANTKKLPIVTGAGSMLTADGVDVASATLAIDYYELGKQTAEIAIKILKGEKVSDEDRHQYYKGATTLEITDTAISDLGLSAERVQEIKNKYANK